MQIIGIVVLVVLIAILIMAYRKDPKIFAKMQAWMKARSVRKDIIVIQEIHDRMTESMDTTGFRNKAKAAANKMKNTVEKPKLKKQLTESKDRYVKYIEFLKEKELPIPLEEPQITNMITETEDALDPKAALDREMERVNRQYDETYSIVNETGEELFRLREQAVKAIDEAEQLVNSIAKTPKSYNKDLKEIRVYKQKFKDASQFGLEQKKALEQSAKNVGAGVAAGTAVATMAPTAAMWVATTFGTASTGTAISALSGAAATNAALAWLGGGALAAGGGGMVAGQALLALAGPVGWGIAGTSILASLVLVWRKKIKAQESKKEEIARMKNCVEALKELKGQMDSLILKTQSQYAGVSEQLGYCNALMNKDYVTFDEQEKANLGALVNNVMGLSKLVSETLGE